MLSKASTPEQTTRLRGKHLGNGAAMSGSRPDTIKIVRDDTGKKEDNLADRQKKEEEEERQEEAA
eukprot:3312820-Rhodomonas_salina.1